MPWIRRYYILELTLLLVALSALGLSVYDFVVATDLPRAVVVDAPPPAVAPTPTLTNNDEQLAQAQASANAVAGTRFTDEADGPAEPNDAVVEMANDEVEDETVGVDSAEDAFDPFETALAQVGLDAEAVEVALADGRSLAEIAAEQGIDSNTLTAALIEQESILIDQLLAAGEIDAEEAEEWREEVATFTPFMVRTPYREPEIVAAAALGISPEALFDELERGLTVRRVATARGLAAETVIAAVVDAEMAYYELMRDAGLIEAEEMRWVREDVVAQANELMDAPFDDE